MCQLTYITTTSNKTTSELLYWVMLANSATANKDGFGLFSLDTRWFIKDNTPIHNSILNFRKTLAIKELNTETVFAHVRAASLVNGKRILDKSKNHPFVHDNFVFFHNGTLTVKNTKKELKIPDDKIDSEFFASRVQERIVNEPGLQVIDAIKKEYEEFWDGKFAFLVYDLATLTPYIIRGSSATLYKGKIFSGDEQIGTIVNTEKDSLENGFGLFNCSNIYRYSRPLALKDVELIPTNTVNIPQNFEIEQQTINIRESYPTTVVTKTYTTNRTNGYDEIDYEGGSYPLVPFSSKTLKQDFGDDVNKKLKEIFDFMNKFNIGFRGLDIICRIFVETPLTSLTEKDLDVLLLSIDSLDTDYENKPRKHKDLFKDAIALSAQFFGSLEDLCDYYSLEFPIQSNEYNKVRRTITKLRYEMGKETISV